jgi:molecular chaperone DnaK (HSP70)
VVRSPKTLLGKGTKVHVGGVAREPMEIVAAILHFLRNDAKAQHPGREFEHAIVTIPVNMMGRSRRELRDAALSAGLHIVQFVHEPLAALYGFMRSQADFRKQMDALEGQIALVFDWGGGTVDLTLCKFTRGTLVQIRNKGDDNVGGDRFDELLLRKLKDRHAVKHRIETWPGEMPGAEARLLWDCESAKIELSAKPSYPIYVANFLRAEGVERNLDLTLERKDLEDWTKDLVDAGFANIDTLLESAGVRESSISLCLATGGMVNMPAIRNRLDERFGRVRAPVILNGDRIIAEGAAWIAHDTIRVRLAKPFELRHADNTYVTILPENTVLPIENGFISETFGMYCVDPRDGYAKFEFARPRWPDRKQAADPRDPYETLTLRVDPTASPLFERLDVNLQVDGDLIVTIAAQSQGRGDQQSVEIHNLEFGLGMPGENAPDSSGREASADASDLGPRRAMDQLKVSPRVLGEVRLRSNVTKRQTAWDLVPGEIIENYKPGYFLVGNNPSHRQIDERLYYRPCALCGRAWFESQWNGCDECARLGTGPSASEAMARRDAIPDMPT